MQGDHDTLAGERPGVHVMDATDPRYPSEMHLDLPDTKAWWRAFEQNMPRFTSQLIAGAKDQN